MSEPGSNGERSTSHLPASQASPYEILDERLQAVQKAISRFAEDEEGQAVPAIVHRLRVSTRRADAAVKLLGDSARKSRLKRLRKRLNEVRDAASALRTCHVDRAALVGMRVGLHGHHVSAAEAAAVLCDVDASLEQVHLSALVERIGKKKLSESIDDFLHSCRRNTRNDDFDSPQLRCRLTEVLPPVLQNMLAVVEKNPDASFQALHELRLQGKKVRYGLEVFAPCLDAKIVSDALGALTELQDALGALNDGRELTERLREYARRAGSVLHERAGDREAPNKPSDSSKKAGSLSENLAGLADLLEKRFDNQRSDFLARWQNGFRGRLLSILNQLAAETLFACSNDFSGSKVTPELQKAVQVESRPAVAQAFVEGGGAVLETSDSSAQT